MDYGLITPEFDFSDYSGLSLRFWHWVEAEYGVDGGNVKYSTDGGNAFITLGYVGDPKGVNWYNVNASGRPAFSGHTGKWVYSSYDISQFDNHNGPVQFKFDFFSNHAISFNGWAIDDFMITVEKAPLDAGVTNIFLPVITVPEGNTFQVMVRIKNFGKDPLTSIPLAVQVNEGMEIQDTWTGLLQPGAAVNYLMAPNIISPGYMELKAYTKLPGDPYHFNDTAYRQVGHIGIQDLPAGPAFAIAPNPANDLLRVTLSERESSGPVQFILTDMTGRVVKERQEHVPEAGDVVELSLGTLKQGVYVLNVISEKGSSAARVVVAR